MLHMMIATHGPETCPGAHDEVKEKAIAGIDALTAGAGGVTLMGGWANRPAHALTFVVDAPNAHVVHDLATEIGLAEWSTVSVQPVIDIGELRDTLASS